MISSRGSECECARSSKMKASGSANTVNASSKSTPCLRRFAASLRGSHSNCMAGQYSGSVKDEKDTVGLCATCAHARQIISDRGATFYQCGLSATDASFPKYPRLPVLACRGYESGQCTVDSGQ